MPLVSIFDCKVYLPSTNKYKFSLDTTKKPADPENPIIHFNLWLLCEYFLVNIRHHVLLEKHLCLFFHQRS